MPNEPGGSRCSPNIVVESKTILCHTANAHVANVFSHARVQAACVELLLQNKANPNDESTPLTPWDGVFPPESALFHVGRHDRLNQLKLVTLLLDCRADPNVENPNYKINATEAACIGSDCRRLLRERQSKWLLEELNVVLVSQDVSLLIVSFCCG